MSSKKVVIELTLAEAQALSYGMDGSITDKETAYAFYLYPPRVAAAYRASEKLDAAIRKVLPKERKVNAS